MSLILQAIHTHLYPGHRGKISGAGQIADLGEGRDCLVEFVDGSATPARLSISGKDWRLDTQPYRTAAGTEIAARRWRIRLTETGDELTFRVLARLGPG